MVDKLFWIMFLVLQVSQVSSFWLFPKSAIGANSSEQRHVRPRRQIECKQLVKGITLQNIIDAGCTHIKPASEHLQFNIIDEPSHWSRFAANLRRIKEISLVFENSSLKTVDFPNLASVVSSQLVFKNNSQLTLININTTYHLSLLILSVYDNPILETIKLAAGPRLQNEGDGTSVPAGFSSWEARIVGNPQLKTIDMDGIQQFYTEKVFRIGYNGMLEEIKMGSILSFEAGSLQLDGNAALKKIELPKLKEYSGNSVRINKNDKLSTVFFNPQMTKMTLLNALRIMKNKELTTVEIDHSKVQTSNLRIQGNRKLYKDTLAELDKIQVSGKKTFQEVGECIFDDGPIGDFADFEDCQIISSALNFTNSTTGAIATSQLKTINGDVDLAGLCLERVNFLEMVKISGTIKSDVCNLKLTNHAVNSPNCSETSCAAYVPLSTTTIATITIETIAQSGSTPSSRFSATTKLVPFVKPSKVTPSGSRNSTEKPPTFDENTAKTNGSKTRLICGVLGGAVLIMVILTIICCCVRVPAGGGKKGRVKLYARVFSCCSEAKASVDKGSSHSSHSSKKEESSKSGSSDELPKKRLSEVQWKTTSRGSAQLSQESRPLLEQQNNSKASADGSSSKKEKVAKQSGEKQERLAEVGQKTTSRGSAQDAQAPTGQPGPSREPEQAEGREAEPVNQGRLRSFLQSISARLPTISLSAKTAKAPAPGDPTVPKGPERFIVTKDGEVLRQPRINYQHELLNKMEDFLGNEENYEDLLEEVKSSKDEVKSSKKTEDKTHTENDENSQKDAKK